MATSTKHIFKIELKKTKKKTFWGHKKQRDKSKILIQTGSQDEEAIFFDKIIKQVT